MIPGGRPGGLRRSQADSAHRRCPPSAIVALGLEAKTLRGRFASLDRSARRRAAWPAGAGDFLWRPARRTPDGSIRRIVGEFESSELAGKGLAAVSRKEAVERTFKSRTVDGKARPQSFIDAVTSCLSGPAHTRLRRSNEERLFGFRRSKQEDRRPSASMQFQARSVASVRRLFQVENSIAQDFVSAQSQ